MHQVPPELEVTDRGHGRWVGEGDVDAGHPWPVHARHRAPLVESGLRDLPGVAIVAHLCTRRERVADIHDQARIDGGHDRR